MGIPILVTLRPLRVSLKYQLRSMQIRASTLLSTALLIPFLGICYSQANSQPGTFFNQTLGYSESDSLTITQSTLMDLDVNSVGLIPSSVSGFPKQLWKGSTTSAITDQISRMGTNLVPEALELLYVILLAESDPPIDSLGEGKLFLVRIDKLLELGALDHANVLMDRAGRSVRKFFQRRFNIALLTNNETQICQEILRDISIQPTLAQRIYCLVRLGEWETASVAFKVAQALGEFSPLEEQIILIYLYPELTFKTSGFTIDELSPLHFRMLVDSGYSYSFQNMNNTLGYYQKNSNSPWKTRIGAHESLVQSIALPFETLLVTYAENKPPASGGVWDRVNAIQSLEEAIYFDREDDINKFFHEAFKLMLQAGLEVEFSKYFVPRIINHLLEYGKIPPRHFIPVILSDLSINQRDLLVPTNRNEAFYIDLKFGRLNEAIPNSALQESILEGLKIFKPGDKVELNSRSNINGLALLETLDILQDITQTPPHEIGTALETLSRFGLKDEAREIALQILLIENEKYQMYPTH